MEKNVGSVDLEELKRAREALNQERGIENNPNEYAYYNPNRDKEEQEPYSDPETEEIISNDEPSAEETEMKEPDFFNVDFLTEIAEEAEKQAKEEAANPVSTFDSDDDYSDEDENDEEESDEDLVITFDIGLNDPEETEDTATEIDTEEDSDEEDEKNENTNPTPVKISRPLEPTEEPANFDVYDKFAEFEIKNEFAGRRDSYIEEDEDDEDYIESEEDSSNDFISTDTEYERNEEDEYVASDETNEIDDEIISDVSSEEDNETADEENTEIENTDLTADEETEEVDETEESEEDDVVEQSENDEEPVEVSQPQPVEDNFAEVLRDGKLGELLQEEDEDNELDTKDEDEIIVNEPKLTDEVEKTTPDREAQISNAIAEARQVTQKIAEEQNVEEEPVEDEQPQIVPFDPIEEYDFLEVMSSRVFKSSNSFSYLIGKDEEGELVFENLKTMHNTAIFGSNDKQISSYISSIILSLMIKNSSEDFKFAICDPSLRSGFDVFEGSSYMWFDSVKKSETDIFDALDKVADELEVRYKNLAKINAKNISEFNSMVEPEYQMSHILFVFNNYPNIYNYSNYDEINATLYALLKLGRLVGIHTFITSNEYIENSNINFNLPTRIAFSLTNADDGASMLGENGVERLTDNGELLHLAVSEELPTHLKAPKLKINEIRLILQNIEN